jgi:predicted ester cyclase
MPVALVRYVGAWNDHDGGGIIDTFIAGGTYTDPMTEGLLTGPAIAAYAEGLWQSFPDLRFELAGPVIAEGDTLYMPWKMLGTNTGSFHGLPPTGRTVTLPGVDLVETSADGLQSVTGYFDSRAVPTQLGLQVIVQPNEIGPFSFGTSTRVVSGRNSAAGAFSVTSLEPSTPESQEEIRQLGRETLKEMLAMDGFIAATSVTCGNRQLTFVAWEKDENIAQMRNSNTHNEAMRRYYNEDLTRGGVISVWQSPRTMHSQRCPKCDAMVAIERSDGRCRCGQVVEPVSRW